jgi:hypothetical protein
MDRRSDRAFAVGFFIFPLFSPKSLPVFAFSPVFPPKSCPGMPIIKKMPGDVSEFPVKNAIFYVVKRFLALAALKPPREQGKNMAVRDKDGFPAGVIGSIRRRIA